MPEVQDVANYFLSLNPTRDGLTHSKLQLLCAYAQGMSLALLDRPLFPEPLEARAEEPVIAALAEKYAPQGEKVLPGSGLAVQQARQPFDDEQKFILELVWNYYGDSSVHALRRRSSCDFPADYGSGETITPQTIKDAFKKNPVVLKLKNLSQDQLVDDPLVPEADIRLVLGG